MNGIILHHLQYKKNCYSLQIDLTRRIIGTRDLIVALVIRPFLKLLARCFQLLILTAKLDEF
jgi:hypothetical protein